jgi:hypothetical protein
MSPLTAWKRHRDIMQTRRRLAREFNRLLAQADALHEVRAAAREIPPGRRLTTAALAARTAGIGAGTITRTAMNEALEAVLDTDPGNGHHEDQVLTLVASAVYRPARKDTGR